MKLRISFLLFYFCERIFRMCLLMICEGKAKRMGKLNGLLKFVHWSNIINYMIQLIFNNSKAFSRFYSSDNICLNRSILFLITISAACSFRSSSLAWPFSSGSFACYSCSCSSPSRFGSSLSPSPTPLFSPSWLSMHL